MAAQADGHDEGVIQYALHHEEGSSPASEVVAALETVRRPLFESGLIGRDPGRYGGLGFGNVSCRTGRGFVITGTQTGHRAVLMDHDYVTVTGWDVQGFALRSAGRVKPSSEAMTHAMLYDVLPQANVILHVHATTAWQRLRHSGYPQTPPEAGYGSPAMAAAVAHLAAVNHWYAEGVMVMAGHEDGLIAFGATPGAAYHRLMAAVTGA